MRLLTPGDIRELAGRLGVRPSKRLGQNFVVEPGTVRRIAALAALEPQDVVLEVGPGLGSLTLALLEAGAGRVVGVEIDPVLAAELPRTIAARAPGLADRAGRGRRGRAPYRRPRPARRAVGAGGEPAVQRGGAGAAAPAGRPAVAAAGAGHGPGRGGGPDVRRAGITGVRHAVGEAGLVRRGPPGRAGAAQRVLAGAERGFPAGRVHPAGSAGIPRRAARRCSRSSTRPSGSGARRCAPRCPAGPARRRRPNGCSARPASTRAPAANRSMSRSSRGWRRRASQHHRPHRVRFDHRDRCDRAGARQTQPPARGGSAAC